MTYAVRNARWTPLYDARLDTGARDRKPALELVRRAEITQNTGEDWSNVALTVSTVRTARGGNAPDLNSLIVQYPQLPRPVASASAPLMVPPEDRVRQFRLTGGNSDGLMMEKAAEQQAAADVGGFQVMFKIPGRVSLGASEGAKSLRVSTATIAPDLAVRAAPVKDPTAFLEASFKQNEDAPLLPGPGFDLSRRRLRRPRPDERRRQGRNRAARLRRRRQDQDRAFRPQAQRGHRPA